MTRLLSLLLLLIWSHAAQAHEVRPALFEITRDGRQTCHIRWKQPTNGEVAVRLIPHLSGGWLAAPPARDLRSGGQRSVHWIKPGCTAAMIERQSFTVDGLDATITEVLVRIDYGDGESRQHILRPGDPPFSLARAEDPSASAAAYFRLGVEHILQGIDHLAFVLALVLLVGFRPRLLATVTGFTIAHSLTLAATALGFVQPWPAFIEMLVALSIVFVAAEVLRARGEQPSLTARWPEIVALGFGLLHGFAFAGALAEIGLPKNETLLALLLFNVGVEAGQLLFIAGIFLISLTAKALLRAPPQWSRRLLPYTIGIAAGFWFIDRAADIFS